MGAAKFNSLKGRWFQTRKKLTTTTETGPRRNAVIVAGGNLYRVLSVYQKSYGKWRIVRSGSQDKNSRLHCIQLEWTSIGEQSLRKAAACQTIILHGDEITTTYK